MNKLFLGITIWGWCILSVPIFIVGYFVIQLLNSPLPTPQSLQTTPIINNCQRPVINKDNVMILVNEYRLSKGLPQLNRNLQDAEVYAQLRANEANSQATYSHSSQYVDFLNWIKTSHKNAQNQYLYFGELLMVNQGTACDVVNAWKNSPTHNDLILNPKFSEMGIGISNYSVVLELLQINPNPQPAQSKPSQTKQQTVPPKSQYTECQYMPITHSTYCHTF